MRIACPGCAAEYEVPSTSLRPHLKVRCARCNAEWVPVQDAVALQPDDAPAAEAEIDPVPPIGETAMDRLAAAAPPRPSVVLRAAWLATILVLAGSAASAVIWRNHVTQMWPASARLLGLVDRVAPAQSLPADAKPRDAKPRDAKPGDAKSDKSVTNTSPP
jgi:predicted Zn finger-like uncharacterized protein